MNDLYTIVASYQSFWAITQHRGATIRGAIEDWVRTFSFVLLEEQNLVTADQISVLKQDLVKAEPAWQGPEFAGMWFVFSELGKLKPIRGGVFGLHIIHTVH